MNSLKLPLADQYPLLLYLLLARCSPLIVPSLLSCIQSLLYLYLYLSLLFFPWGSWSRSVFLSCTCGPCAPLHVVHPYVQWEGIFISPLRRSLNDFSLRWWLCSSLTLWSHLKLWHAQGRGKGRLKAH